MVILFSIQTTIIGVIGEYVGRIHLEIKKRPLYFADIIQVKKSND
jgi:dolichol-phosphate mannosyltransferase